MNHSVSYLRLCGYVCFIILSILSEATQTGGAQPEVKGVNSNHFAKHSQSAESVMNAIIDPKILLASAKDQMGNFTNNITTFSQVTPGLPSVTGTTTVLLSHQILPPKDFVPVYDSAPYTISKAYLTAKLPCDSGFHSRAYVLFGELTNLKPAVLVPVKQLSAPGYLCMYNSYLSSSEFITMGNNRIVTDIVLLNPTSHRIVMLNTSTLILSIKEGLPHPMTSN